MSGRIGPAKALIQYVLIAVALFGQLNAQLRSQRNGSEVAVAVQTKTPPRLDGTLNDVIWETAPVVDNFRQREPLESQSATEKTEIHILYDSHRIYFGILCYDRDPRSIVASQLRRDLSQDLDDNFAILLDPTFSRRNGFIFQVNPLGTQRDGEVIEEHLPPQGDSIVDASWDGVWTSASKITTDGWTATVAIPFTTLNFSGGSSVWGVNFRRFVRRKNEEDEWSGYRRIYGFWRTSQAGELRGISGIDGKRLLVVRPYGLVGAQSTPNMPVRPLHTGGVDMKYGLGSNLIALGTVNTDFSDADVDQQQFNLTPYPILIPEKRSFFLEDADIFNFPLWSQDLLLFSRQIGIDPVSGQEVPIDAGGKIAGQSLGFDLGLMDVRTRADGTNPYSNYAVARVKRPLMPGSYVGVMAADKESGNPLDPSNRTLGLDARFLFFRNLSLRGYYVKSWSPGLSGDNAAFGGRLGYANNWFNVYGGHGVTEKHFNPEMGFVARTDDQPTDLDFNFTPRPHLLNIRELDVGAFVNYDPNTANKLIYREWAPNITALFNNGAEIDASPEDVTYQYLAQPLNLYQNVSIPPGRYRFASHQIAYTSAGDRRLTYTASFQAGDYYTGTLKAAAFTAQYRPNPHLALAVNNTLNVFRLPQGNFNIELAGLQVGYAFNRFVNLTTFLQADTAQTKAASANVRLRYTFRPDSDLYVIYNLGTRFQSLAAGNPMPVREEKFAVKITYSWSR